MRIAYWIAAGLSLISAVLVFLVAESAIHEGLVAILLVACGVFCIAAEVNRLKQLTYMTPEERAEERRRRQAG